jgi:hypothetical protein
MKSNGPAAALVALLALAASVGLAIPMAAHEGHHHQAMGTVKVIHDDHLMLETTDGKERTFLVSVTTKYLRGKTETTREDVTAGERAVVVYETKAGADHAVEVKLGEKKP